MRFFAVFPPVLVICPFLPNRQLLFSYEYGSCSAQHFNDYNRSKILSFISTLEHIEFLVQHQIIIPLMAIPISHYSSTLNALSLSLTSQYEIGINISF